MPTISTMNIVEANKRAGFTNEAEFMAPLVIEDPFSSHIPWYHGNGKEYHTRTKAAAMGTGDFFGYNEGMQLINGKVTSDRMNYAMYGAATETAKKLVDDSLKPAITRQTEALLGLHGVMQGFTKTLFTCRGTSPDSFKGLEVQRGKLGMTTKYHGTSYDLVFDGGSTNSSARTSIWLCQFGEDKLCMRSQPGKPFGLTHTDAGVHDSFDANGNRYQVYRDEFVIEGVLDIYQANSVIRLANVDPSIATGTGAFTEEAASDMLACLPDQSWNNTIFFAHPKVLAQLRKYVANKSNVQYSYTEFQGLGKVLSLWGVPVLPQGTLSLTESAVA